MGRNVVIGIDQSYKRTGISIAIDGKLKIVKSTDFKNCKSNTEKRRKLAKILRKILTKYENDDILIITERIRLRSQQFLSINYIKTTSSLVSTIIDVASDFGFSVYSVDTRAWKSAIVGNSKGRETFVTITRGKNKGKTKKVIDRKIETIEFVQGLGFDVNDDEADSACIALYGFLPENKRLIKVEDF